MATFYDEEFVAAVTGIALAGDGLVLGVGMALLAAHSWMKYRFRAKALKKVRATPLSHIADLRCLLLSAAAAAAAPAPAPAPVGEETLSAAGKETLFTHYAMHQPHLAPPEGHRDHHCPQQQKQEGNELMVIVRGRVLPEIDVHPRGHGDNGEGFIVAENSGIKAVVVEKVQTCMYHERRGVFGWRLEWKSLLGWNSLKENITSSRRVMPFVLVEGFTGSRSAFTIIDLANSRHPLPLTTVYHQLHPAQPASYTLLQAIFGQRFMVGILDEEKILPIGKEMTAIGHLTSSPEGSPVIEPSNDMPYFLTNVTRDQLINELADEARTFFWTGIFVSGIAAGILAYSISKNWGKWNRWRQERQKRKEHENLARLSAGNDVDVEENVPDGELCVICILRRRRAAFVSCGHRVCCISCAHKVVNNHTPRCPVCRQNVESVICIYDA